MHFFLALLVVVVSIYDVSADSQGPQISLAVTGNPHMPIQQDEATAGGQCWGEAGGCPAGQLDVSQLVLQVKTTQMDTFLGITHVKYMDVPVPVYKFRQPADLNPNQLPFKLALVNTIDQEGIQHLEVPYHMSLNSWFIGYGWEVVVCNKCGTTTHLGWRFTSTSQSGDHFYALIVDYAEDSQPKSIAGSIADIVADSVSVGMRGPAASWIMALMGSADGDSGQF